ncbi:hypothetical protein Bca101_095460 [Brassica carinata]
MSGSKYLRPWRYNLFFSRIATGKGTRPYLSNQGKVLVRSIEHMCFHVFEEESKDHMTCVGHVFSEAHKQSSRIVEQDYVAWARCIGKGSFTEDLESFSVEIERPSQLP